MNMPKLKMLKTMLRVGPENYYIVEGTEPFYLFRNHLIIKNNDIEVSRIKCIRVYEDTFKIFAYKCNDITSNTMHFLLDIEHQRLYQLLDGSKSMLYDFIEYVLDNVFYNEDVYAQNGMISDIGFIDVCN